MPQVRVKDLKYTSEPNTMLLCKVCGAQYSATRGDYFWASPEHVLRCHVPLSLVRKHTHYEEVKP